MVVIIIIVALALMGSKLKPRFGSANGSGDRSGSGIRKPATPLRTPPEYLGVPEGHPARPAAERIERLLTADFAERVKDRVLRNEPRLREGEWQWRWFELKRYFLMCAIARGVPMYGSRVDDVWHEMLMFTREYEQFCNGFCGHLIHHAPHTGDTRPDPGERAWFDWLYGELFLPVSGSADLWGSFYRTPMPQAIMRELASQDAEELRERRFNVRSAATSPDLAGTIEYLIARGRRLAGSRDEPPRNGLQPEETGRDSDWPTTILLTGMLSGPFFYSSWGTNDEFQSRMDGYRTEEEELQKNAGGGCGSAYSCSGSSDGGNNGDNGGNDSGNSSRGNDGSSCSGSCSGGSDSGSSCGGGSSCGSSCGGGGGD